MNQIEILLQLKACIESIHVHGKEGCMRVIACCNTIDGLIQEIQKAGSEEK